MCVARANEVFSRGGLCQSGEGGPAVLPYCHIKSVSVSLPEKEMRKRTCGRCEESQRGERFRGRKAPT